MARDLSKAHPDLQYKMMKLVEEVRKQLGIEIRVGECVRSVAEQDYLYAQGRTRAGSIVTNSKGKNYSSMHQFGVAADIFLNVDVDKDGKTNDDIYNNTTGLFNKIGAIGQSIGLEWGGSWKSFKDLPHFQLPDWGSTTAKLKKMYGTPEKFMATWGKSYVPSVAIPKVEEHFYPTLGPDSVFVRLQKALGVPVGSSAEATLEKTITVLKGCNGQVVALLQEYWTGLGFYSGKIDGDWGKLSDSAAYMCQKKVVGLSNPDKVYSRKGASWKKALAL